MPIQLNNREQFRSIGIKRRTLSGITSILKFQISMDGVKG